VERLAGVCPSCGSHDIVPIRYGLPGSDMFQRAERGEIILGGCEVDATSPNLKCRECEHAWQTDRATGIP